MTNKIKVIHFVTGGFSGATNLAVELVQAHNSFSNLSEPNLQSLLVLRQKKTTTADKLARLDSLGIDYQVVTGSSHLATIFALKKICQEFQPDILVAHGFPEHLIGRWAGKQAGVPHLIQVEHASKERYTPFRLWQTRHLSKYTDYAIGVSQGVADVLRSQNLSCKIMAIANGIDTQKFSSDKPLVERQHDIIMVARFSKGKNHAVLLDALALLKNQNITPKLNFLGAGNGRHEQAVVDKIAKLGLQDQVMLLGHCSDMAEQLASHKVFVLASFHEGLSLSVIEAMASGCVVVGSDVVGISELIEHEQDGFLFDVNNATQLADILATTLSNIESYQAMATLSQQKTVKYYDKSVMAENYLKLFSQLTNTNDKN
ncbi:MULTISPECIES: glycosyltransferase [unclassified Moraxella]|uniref:glycosyltransferase n=1 Tax=unclassified Moraxella TaxID=2685852 RepID=UPI003AF648DF